DQELALFFSSALDLNCEPVRAYLAHPQRIPSQGASAMDRITVVGAGIAGLTAAISCAEQGAPVVLVEAHEQLGGRARTLSGPYKANLGPHALLSGSPFWHWMGERALLPPAVRPPLSGVRFRWRDDIRRVPAVGATIVTERMRGKWAPVQFLDHTWANR